MQFSENPKSKKGDFSARKSNCVFLPRTNSNFLYAKEQKKGSFCSVDFFCEDERRARTNEESSSHYSFSLPEKIIILWVSFVIFGGRKTTPSQCVPLLLLGRPLACI